MKLKLNIGIEFWNWFWNWNSILQFNFEIEFWNWILKLKLKFNFEFWNWVLKLKLNFTEKMKKGQKTFWQSSATIVEHSTDTRKWGKPTYEELDYTDEKNGGSFPMPMKTVLATREQRNRQLCLNRSNWPTSLLNLKW